MYVIFNRIKVKEECLQDFLTGVRIHASHSNNEPECVRYDVLQDVNDPYMVILYEVFENENAFKSHLTQEHYKDWMEKSRDWRHSEDRIRHVLDFIYQRED